MKKTDEMPKSKRNLFSVIVQVQKRNCTECVNKCAGMRDREVFIITAAAFGDKCTPSR